MSRTFLAVLQYDGGNFLGWQRQKSGRSVQGDFEQVLARLTGDQIPAHGSRPDRRRRACLGARGELYVAPERWTADSLQRALNALLPRDCWVASVHRMEGRIPRPEVRRRDVGTATTLGATPAAEVTVSAPV